MILNGFEYTGTSSATPVQVTLLNISQSCLLTLRQFDEFSVVLPITSRTFVTYAVVAGPLARLIRQVTRGAKCSGQMVIAMISFTIVNGKYVDITAARLVDRTP